MQGIDNLDAVYALPLEGLSFAAWTSDRTARRSREARQIVACRSLTYATLAKAEGTRLCAAGVRSIPGRRALLIVSWTSES